MISLDKISFSYSRKKPLIANLDLKIQAGSIHGLLGKNGAGKTTLLKIIAGLRHAQSGKSKVLGFDPAKREIQFLEQIFFVPEEIFLPSCSAKNYISRYAGFYPLFNYGMLKEYMHSFDLEDDMHLGRVSFGQKKKFLLAFAMASGTSLVLFDEPTNGLDIPSKSVFRKLAAAAINDNRCFIISTHQVRDLNLLLDSVLILEKGQILINSSLFDIASKYSFITVPRKESKENILYSEEHIEGIKAIVPHSIGLETEVDLEILFNATIFGKLYQSQP